MSTVFEMRDNSDRRGRMVKRLEVYTDSDWASDQVTRKSTSGVVIMAEGMRLHAHSRGQASVALSSSEAEVMAASEGIKEALLLQEVLMFVGLGHYEIEVKVDSSAAHAFFRRRGVGRMKHIDSRILWLQDLIAAGGARLKKIPRTQNLADMLTHTPSAKELEMFLPLMSLRSWWHRGGTNRFQLKIWKCTRIAEGACQIQLCIPAMQRHVSIWCDCSYVVRWVHSIGQEWKCRKQTRQRMESAIETSDLKLSGDLVQTSKNCDAKHERTFNSSATDLYNGWTSLEGDVGTYSVETWVPWPIELCDVSSGRVIGIFCCFSSARLNWCSYASVVIFSNSVVVKSLSSFSVPFSVISMLHSARCMSLLSVGVVE